MDPRERNTLINTYPIGKEFIFDVGGIDPRGKILVTVVRHTEYGQIHVREPHAPPNLVWITDPEFLKSVSHVQPQHKQKGRRGGSRMKSKSKSKRKITRRHKHLH